MIEERSDGLCHARLVGEHSCHCSIGGEGLHEMAAFGNEFQCILRAEYPGYAGCHILAHAMPQYHIGFYSP